MTSIKFTIPSAAHSSLYLAVSYSWHKGRAGEGEISSPLNRRSTMARDHIIPMYRHFSQLKMVSNNYTEPSRSEREKSIAMKSV